MNLPITIAWRYLRSKKAHSAVNIISVVSVAAVMVTTAALVCVLSVFNGFHDLLYSRLSMINPDLAITSVHGRTIDSADSVLNVVRTTAGVECATATIESQALARYADYQMPVNVKGVDDDYMHVTRVGQLIVDGEYLLSDGISNYAVSSIGPAYRLALRAGYLKMLNLYAPRRRGQVSMANPMTAFRSDSVFVSGIFMVEQNTYDKDVMIVPIEVARKLFDYPTQATTIEVLVNEQESVEKVQNSLKSKLGACYNVLNRLQQQTDSFKMVNTEKWMSFLLLAFIMLIAAFNVVSSLSLLISEKKESITIFRSMGATDSTISRIFISQGWIISMIGAVGGVILGVVLCLIQQYFGIITMQGDTSVMLVQEYPVRVVFSDVIVVLALAALIGIITSIASSLTMHNILRKK